MVHHEDEGEGGCLVEQKEEEIGQEKPEREDHGAYMQEIEAESKVMCELKVDVHVGKKERSVYQYLGAKRLKKKKQYWNSYLRGLNGYLNERACLAQQCDSNW